MSRNNNRVSISGGEKHKNPIRKQIFQLCLLTFNSQYPTASDARRSMKREIGAYGDSPNHQCFRLNIQETEKSDGHNENEKKKKKGTVFV